MSKANAKKELIKNYAEAIKQAENAAQKANTGEDGGACNFDSALIELEGWSKKDIQKLEKESGLEIGAKMSGYWKNCCRIDFSYKGQADNRSRMANAAYNILKELKIPTRFYCQMD